MLEKGTENSKNKQPTFLAWVIQKSYLHKYAYFEYLKFFIFFCYKKSANNCRSHKSILYEKSATLAPHYQDK